MDIEDTASRAVPYGAWESPLSPDDVTRAGVYLSTVRSAEGALYWLERRPLEQGRTVVVRHAHDGAIADVTPPGFDVRSRVHEYGGGAYTVAGDVVFFVRFSDQRLYRHRIGEAPVPITPEPSHPAGLRYADADVLPGNRSLVCVRESHAADAEAVNEIVILPTDGGLEPRVLASGHDFYAAPRVSPNGTQIAWICWDHPRMPWDGTELWLADLSGDGVVSGARRLAGGPSESVTQPRWSAGGELHFVSDRTGWWNLYAWRQDAPVALAPAAREFDGPQWDFAHATYAFLADGRLVCAPVTEGRDKELVIVTPDGGIESVGADHGTFDDSLAVIGESVAFVGTSPRHPARIVSVNLGSGSETVLRESAEHPAPTCVSEPRSIEFPTGDGERAYAFLYEPFNPGHAAPEGALPPLLVIMHGGPTGATTSAYNATTQFWTSRGFLVADVNYRGSTGYGRAFRDALMGRCGIVDVEDCVNLAQHLAREGRVDGEHMAIRGGSAGGYIVLASLAFHDVFAAGASYFGVADPAILAAETHKFESRYIDQLIGPYSGAEETYRERSPLHHADGISVPVILFQGADDKVVPPSQSELMVAALRSNGVPHAYLLFEGEAHGFRRAETQRRCLEAELAFYGRVFGFSPAGRLGPLSIDGLD